MLCDRCGQREAEIFQTQRVGEELRSSSLCLPCSREDYGVFLGAFLAHHHPDASLSPEQERTLRRVLDEAGTPPEPRADPDATDDR